jgi:hypothetical protein
MSLVRPKFAFILLLMGGLCLPISNSAQTADSSTKKVSHRSTKPKAAKAAKKVEEEQPPAPAPAPPPPPTPEQMPSQPPTVTYEHGQLAIVAPNSTLSDILHAVRNKTGANIDIPPGANERVVSSFGPGPARDVLASLLNGSHFNYVMVGTEADPTAVAQVILTPRTGGETPPTVQAGQPGAPIRPALPAQQFPQPYPQPQIQGQAQAPGAEEPAASDGMEEDDTSQDNNADNNNDQGAPEQVQGSEGQGQNPNQPVVKTPEQLLLELQRQQQTMQQQQQQGKQPQSVSPNPQQPPQQQQQPQ